MASAESLLMANYSIGASSTVAVAASSSPCLPAAPGCYRRFPSGCTQEPSLDSINWVLDTGADLNLKVHLNKHTCENVRREQLDVVCQIVDTEMGFVEPDRWLEGVTSYVGTWLDILKHFTMST